jgi:hypothetical protein
MSKPFTCLLAESTEMNKQFAFLLAESTEMSKRFTFLLTQITKMNAEITEMRKQTGIRSKQFACLLIQEEAGEFHRLADVRSLGLLLPRCWEQTVPRKHSGSLTTKEEKLLSQPAPSSLLS